MSITSYLFNVRDFHMPRAGAQPDPLGIRWQGQVLQGRRGVVETIEHTDLTARRQLSVAPHSGAVRRVL